MGQEEIESIERHSESLYLCLNTKNIGLGANGAQRRCSREQHNDQEQRSIGSERGMEHREHTEHMEHKEHREHREQRNIGSIGSIGSKGAN